MTTKVDGKYYISGNTYAVKDAIKALGCRWDAGRKAWYTTDSAVAEKADALVSGKPSSSGRSKPTATTRAAAKRGTLAGGSFQPSKMREPAAGEQLIFRDGRDSYDNGETIHAVKISGGGGPDGHYWTVVACGSHRISQYEDDCREGEWRSTAIVRAATEAEATAKAEQMAGAKAAKEAAAKPGQDFAAAVAEVFARGVHDKGSRGGWTRDNAGAYVDNQQPRPAGSRLATWADRTGLRPSVSGPTVTLYEGDIIGVCQPNYDDSPSVVWLIDAELAAKIRPYMTDCK